MLLNMLAARSAERLSREGNKYDNNRADHKAF